MNVLMELFFMYLDLLFDSNEVRFRFVRSDVVFFGGKICCFWTECVDCVVVSGGSFRHLVPDDTHESRHAALLVGGCAVFVDGVTNTHVDAEERACVGRLDSVVDIVAGIRARFCSSHSFRTSPCFVVLVLFGVGSDWDVDFFVCDCAYFPLSVVAADASASHDCGTGAGPSRSKSATPCRLKVSS
jgi:hypothetical protein